MKNHSLESEIRIRGHFTLLLAGILALGAGLSPVRATDHYLIVSEGAFDLAANWSPEASTTPEGIQNRYINNDGQVYFAKNIELTFNELHIGNGILGMSVGKLSTGLNGGWAVIGDWDSRGEGNTTSVARFQMWLHTDITFKDQLYFARGDGESANSATATVTLSGSAYITAEKMVTIASDAGTATVTLSETAMIKRPSNVAAEFRVGDGVNSDGTLMVTENSAVDAKGKFVIGAFGGTGRVTLTDEGRLTKPDPAAAFYVGDGAGSGGTLTLEDDASVEEKGEFVIGRDGGTGTVTLSGDSKLTRVKDVSAGTQDFYVGQGADAVGTLTLEDDAVVTSAGNFVIGKSGGEGKVTLTDNAAFTVNHGRIWVGGEDSAGSIGELELSGNATLNYTGNDSHGFTIGGANTTGTVTLSGSSTLTSTTNSPLLMVNGDGTNAGTATLTVGGTNSVVDFSSYIVVGERGAEGSTATLNINAGGRVRASHVFLGGSGDSEASEVNGTINLNGGVLETGYVSKGVSASDATRNRLLVNGGVLRATGDQADFIQSGLYVDLQSGGVKIDTQGFAVGIDTDLVGEGGLTKLGEGTLTVFTTLSYAGDTTVSDGVLSIDGGRLANSGNLTVATGAGLELTGELSLNDTIVLNLASGAEMTLDFTGTETIAGMLIGGVPIEAGIYSLADLQGFGSDVVFDGLSGANLSVLTTVVPEPAATGLILLSGLALLCVRRRLGKPSQHA